MPIKFQNIAIIGSGFLGLTLALRLAESGAVRKCGQLFHKFDDSDKRDFEYVCGLLYEIENRNVRELM